MGKIGERFSQTCGLCQDVHNYTETYKNCEWSNHTSSRLCSEMQNTNTWISFPTVLATATAVMLLATALALILDVDVELLVLVGLPVSVLFCITVRALCVCGWLTDSNDDVINIFTPSFTPHFSPELSDDWNIFYIKVSDPLYTSHYSFIYLANFIYKWRYYLLQGDTIYTNSNLSVFQSNFPSPSLQ